MRDYEVVYIFKTTLGTEEIESRLQRYHEKILAVEGSEISAVEHWGKRQLAYPIDRHENGYYVVAQFSSEPEALPEFERLLKLDDEVLRHLVVLSEGELAVPMSLQDEDEDEDDEDEDEDDDDEDERRSRDRRSSKGRAGGKRTSEREETVEDRGGATSEDGDEGAEEDTDDEDED